MQVYDLFQQSGKAPDEIAAIKVASRRRRAPLPVPPRAPLCARVCVGARARLCVRACVLGVRVSECACVRARVCVRASAAEVWQLGYLWRSMQGLSRATVEAAPFPPAPLFACPSIACMRSPGRQTAQCRAGRADSMIRSSSVAVAASHTYPQGDRV